MGIAATAAVILAVPSIAQQPASKTQPKSEPKTQPKSEPKAQPKGAPAPAPQSQQGQTPQLTYTPWTKICQRGPEANARQVCFTGRDGRLETGAPVVAAMLAVPEGQAKRTLRVTLPLGMSIQPGTRVIVDNGQPVNAPYVICINSGCMADYEASEELIGKMKGGQNLFVQGINGAGQPVSLPLPLADFAKAYDGPPSDPKDLNRP